MNTNINREEKKLFGFVFCFSVEIFIETVFQLPESEIALCDRLCRVVKSQFLFFLILVFAFFLFGLCRCLFV